MFSLMEDQFKVTATAALPTKSKPCGIHFADRYICRMRLQIVHKP